MPGIRHDALECLLKLFDGLIEHVHFFIRQAQVVVRLEILGGFILLGLRFEFIKEIQQIAHLVARE